METDPLKSSPSEEASRSTDPGDRVPLDQIEMGHCARVTEVEASEADIGQLMAMGVCVGRRIMLMQTGDPMILKVLGTRIGVSARLARNVKVQPCLGDMFGEG
jgi:Fe2+ transport system protein FeoA